MKKVLTVSLFAAILAVSNANAKDGAYVGLDINSSNVKHKFNDVSGNNYGTYKADHTSVGFGLNAGYKKEFNQVFLAPELFFDYLDNDGRASAYETDNEIKKNNSFVVNYRYGAKLNLGYNVTDKIAPFASVGVAVVDYDDHSSSQKLSYGASEVSAIYGLGVAYNINDQFALKLSGDYQEFAGKSAYGPGTRESVKISTAKIGVAYNF